MKRKGYYLCSLLVMIFVFLSCRDEEQYGAQNEAYKTIY